MRLHHKKVFHPGLTTVITVGGNVLMFSLFSALSLLSLLGHVEMCAKSCKLILDCIFINFQYLQPVLKIKDYRKYEMSKVNGWYPEASAML